MNPDQKPFFTSKTVLINGVIALAAFYPPVGSWISAHPEATLQGLAVVNVLVRLVTKGKITLY